MDIPSALYSALGPVVANRVYPDEAPQTATLPLVVYRLTGQQVVGTIHGNAAPITIDEYSIDVWAETRSGVLALIAPIQTAMRNAVAAGLESNYQGMAWGADVEVGYEGCSLDYTIINRP